MKLNVENHLRISMTWFLDLILIINKEFNIIKLVFETKYKTY